MHLNILNCNGYHIVSIPEQLRSNYIADQIQTMILVIVHFLPNIFTK